MVIQMRNDRWVMEFSQLTEMTIPEAQEYVQFGTVGGVVYIVRGKPGLSGIPILAFYNSHAGEWRVRKSGYNWISGTEEELLFIKQLAFPLQVKEK